MPFPSLYFHDDECVKYTFCGGLIWFLCIQCGAGLHWHLLWIELIHPLKISTTHQLNDKFIAFSVWRRFPVFFCMKHFQRLRIEQNRKKNQKFFSGVENMLTKYIQVGVLESASVLDSISELWRQNSSYSMSWVKCRQKLWKLHYRSTQSTYWVQVQRPLKPF